MTTTAELLQAAKGYIGKGKSIGAPARNKDGAVVDPTDETATSYSIYGALTRAAYDLRSQEGVDQALLLLGVSDLHDPHMDGVTKGLDDEGLAKRFDDAIARAEGGPVVERSLDAEKRMLDPNAEDYNEQVQKLQREISGKPAGEATRSRRNDTTTTRRDTVETSDEEAAERDRAIAAQESQSS